MIYADEVYGFISCLTYWVNALHLEYLWLFKKKKKKNHTGTGQILKFWLCSKTVKIHAYHNVHTCVTGGRPVTQS